MIIHGNYISLCVHPVFLIVPTLLYVCTCVFSLVISIGPLAPGGRRCPKWRKDVDMFWLLLLSPCPLFSMSEVLEQQQLTSVVGGQHQQHEQQSFLDELGCRSFLVDPIYFSNSFCLVLFLWRSFQQMLLTVLKYSFLRFNTLSSIGNKIQLPR